VQALSEMDASWPTTSPQARVASTPDRVPVHDALIPGTRLDEFEIVRVLGTGGFGIVYLARDHVLLRDVAIKEYMPAALAGRGEGVTVSLRAEGFADIFAKGLESFLSEARLLASFDHRSLVKVHRFWRSNATAYMAMQYYSGQTLKDARLHMTSAPDEAWLDAFIQALLGVLELLHGQGVYHRDISPDNILLLEDGRPVLLDFGSARRVMADGPQSFTAHLKPQFAPLEQYAEESGGMRQGPWTDLYALGATLYFVLTGRAPTPSVVRAVRDVLPTLASQAGTTIPSVRGSLLATIDWTLALAPEQRPQSVLSVRRALSGDIAAPPPSPRQLGATAIVAPDSVPAPAPDAAAHTGRAHHATPARPWFSRLAATFWGPAADPLLKLSRTRRRAHLSVAVSLALTGMVALGWGAWTLDRPSSPSGDAASTAEAALATTTKIVATSAVAPMPAMAPATRSAMAPVALWVKPEASQASGPESGLAAEAVSTAPKRSSAASPQAARAAPRDRHRTAPPKVQTSSAAAKSSQPAKNACDGTGVLARAWCAMTPCKAPRGRANPECIERLRAEAARQQRIERQ
jgi:serine/threonine protein kinase